MDENIQVRFCVTEERLDVKRIEIEQNERGWNRKKKVHRKALMLRLHKQKELSYLRALGGW